jgi:tRNA(fMet)-specific endonuclease VapC
MIYLLDSNVCVEFLRGKNKAAAQRMAAEPVANIALCSIVRAELLYGALRSRRPAANIAQVRAFVQPYVSLPFDDDAAEEYGRIATLLAAQGMTIPVTDLMIACIALVRNLTVVTHDVAHFGRFPNLLLEDWQTP